MRYADVPVQLRDAPFTTETALRAGLTRRALQSSPWRHVFQDVWVHASVPDSRQLRFAAVRLILPVYAVVCGLTAAWLYGADVRREDDLEVHVSFPKGRRRPVRPGVRVCQETLRPSDIWSVDGVAVTSPTRTAFDCLRLLRGIEGVVVADALTQLRRTTVDELRVYFAMQRRLRNLRIGIGRLDDVEPKSESPMESRLRLGLVARGLPRPVAQWELRTAAGRVVRLDLAYPELKIAIEYDGSWHFAQRRQDDRRRDAVREMGWVVLVFSAEDVFQNFDAVAATVAAAVRSSRRAVAAR